MAGHDTAIHVEGTDGGGLCYDVDTRLKAGHDDYCLVTPIWQPTIGLS